MPRGRAAQKKGYSTACDQELLDFVIRGCSGMETQIREYVAENGEPEDWHMFWRKKERPAGLVVSAHASPNKLLNEIVYQVRFYMNRYAYEKWAKAYASRFETEVYLSMGPIKYAHPGRDPHPDHRGKQKRIDWSEGVFWINGPQEKIWLNLWCTDLIVFAHRSATADLGWFVCHNY